MPVIDLADYLGMPQQAPANPVFNQTRKSTGVASLDREIDDFYKGAAAIDQLRSLQRQAPVFEAQKAQIAYDKVAQDARDLRMKQEIEAQVERAANELAGGNLNPESDDFGAKYRDLATRNPLAFSDPRFSDVAGLYAAQNQNYQAARKQQMDAERAAAAKANEDLRTAIGGYLQYGGDSEIAKNIKSVEEAKYLEGQMKKAARDKIGTRGGAKDIAGQMMQRDYELVDSEVKRLKDEGEDVIYDANGVVSPNPEFQKLSEERNRLFNKLRGSYQGIYSPAQTPAVQPTTQQQVSVNPNARLSPLSMLPQGSLPAMAGALPTVEAPIQVPITPEGQIDIDKIPFGEIDKTIERVNEQAKAQEEVAKAWNSAQMDLEKKLEKLYPGNIGNTNYAKLARFAKAVLNEELMEDTGKDIVLDENGQPLRVLVGQVALEKLGLPPEGDAFTEPGKARKNFFGIGSQIVPNKQLLETWARNYLNRAPVTVAPTQAPISSEMNLAIENVLNTK